MDREAARALAQLSGVLPAAVPGPRALGEALRGYLEAVQADPGTWRLVLMPPEGAPELLRTRIARGRARVVAQLADAVRPGIGPGVPTPDPELTAMTLSALADECARLVLSDPRRFPAERIVAHARWVLGLLR